MYPSSTKWGSGCIYKTSKGAWRCEWSSGMKRKTSTRPKANIITLHGTYVGARKLLDLIVAVPHRSKEDALQLIAPYIRERNLYGNPSVKIREIIDLGNIGHLPTRQHAVRARIELDYWRLRLLDTIEAYRRFDDD